MSALQPDLESPPHRANPALSRIGRVPSAGFAAESTPEARAAVAAVARELLPALAEITERIRARLLERWPDFGQTAALREELTCTIDTNLRHFFERVLASDPGEPLVAPPEALRFASSVLHHGIDTSELLQAYRVGQNLAWSWWMEHLVREITDRARLLEAIEHSSGRMFAYVDAVIEEQVRLWEDERKRWSGRLAAQRVAAVRQMLSADPTTVKDAARRLGYSLERELLAGIVWERPPSRARPDAHEERGLRLELAADAIAREIGIDRSLVVAPDGPCLWVWFATGRTLDLDGVARRATSHLQEGQMLALGLPARGIEGFRAGHRQALRAHRFAELSHADGPVIRFDEVETFCVMSEDPELLTQFIQRKLRALAADGRNAERLRETVLVWLREGCNASRAAERLRTHKNTVRNRLQRAEQLVGRALSDDRLGLELALTLMQRGGGSARAPSGAPQIP